MRFKTVELEETWDIAERLEQEAEGYRIVTVLTQEIDRVTDYDGYVSTKKTIKFLLEREKEDN